MECLFKIKQNKKNMELKIYNMPDITLCTNKECTIDCYRQKARPNEYRQAYAYFKPNDKGICNYFLKQKTWN